MSMFTRCAHCEIIFQVTLAQLQLAGGQVRCGVCHQVFDAFATLSARDPRLPALVPSEGGDGVDAVEAPAVDVHEGEASAQTADGVGDDEVAPAESDAAVVDFPPEGPIAAMEPVEPAATMAPQPPVVIVRPVDDEEAEPAISAEAPSGPEPVIDADADAPGSLPLSAHCETASAWHDPDIADAMFPVEELREIVVDDGTADQPTGVQAPEPLEARSDIEGPPTPARSTQVPPEDATEPPARAEADPAEATVPEAAITPAVGAGPASPRFALPRPGRMPASLVAGIVLLSVVLVLQGTYLMRAALAEAAPAFRTPLEQACRWLRCMVPLPRLTDRLFIEASELQALDPLHPNRVTFTATIRNRAPVEQAMPLLELTLTDAREEVVARKIFGPGEYLSVPSAGPGVAANAELGVRLRLDTADIVATGYRLYLFHP